MQLSDLTSQGFRNLTPDPVSFGAGITLVCGENAQGKTNLLEALSLVCGQRSFRGARAAEMATDGVRFTVAASVIRHGADERIGVGWSKEAGRQFFRAGKAAGFREISSLAPAVFLAPEHRDLLGGSPAERRRFLDRLVLGLKPSGAEDLVRYASALKERNALLARCRSAIPGGIRARGDELSAWSDELAIAGDAVRRHRRAALSLWEEEFAPLCEQAGGDFASIRVAYRCESRSEEDLRGALERLLPLERRRGHSLAGPHRDDLVWTRGDAALAGRASSGEVARTVALVKLAEWRALARATGELPLFAADDFDAGLSECSADELLAALPGESAVVLTSSAPSSRWSRRAAAVYEMRAGAPSSRPGKPSLRAVEA